MQAKHGQVKVSEYFFFFFSFTSSLYEEFLGICHSSLYFAILTFINYSVLHLQVKKKKNQTLYLVSE